MNTNQAALRNIKKLPISRSRSCFSRKPVRRSATGTVTQKISLFQRFKNHIDKWIPWDNFVSAVCYGILGILALSFVIYSSLEKLQ